MTDLKRERLRRFRIVDLGSNHHCDPPGWLERRRLGLANGAVIECVCGRWWRFHPTGWHPTKKETPK